MRGEVRVTKKKVLIVEDEAIIAKSLQLSLEKSGYAIGGVVYSGTKALDIIQKDKPDILLVDIRLGGDMDGIEVAEKVREIADIPFIYLTAYADERTLIRAKRTNPNGYLIKPIGEKDLSVAIEVALYKHEAEKRVKEKDELLRKVMMNMDQGLIIVDQDGMIEYMNPVAEELTGCDNCLNLEISKILHFRSDCPETPILTPIQDVLRHGITLKERGHYLISKEGAKTQVEIHASPVTGEEGRSVGAFIIFKDIGEREKILKELKQSEERLRDIIEEDITGDFIASTQGDILFCNSEFLRIFGLQSREEAHQTSLPKLFTSSDNMNKILEKLRREGRIKYSEHEMMNQQGRRIFIMANLTGRFDEDNNLVEIAGYIIDNTERKEIEMQLLHSQKLRALGNLSSVLAHDFNNILTVIMGHGELLHNRAEKNAKVTKSIETIRMATERASNLTKKLLTYSQRQHFRPEPVQFNHIIGDFKKLISPLCNDDIQINYDLDPQLWITRADPSQVEQLIMNLVVNARDAMDRGGELTIRTRNAQLDESIKSEIPDLKPGKYICIEVEDSGHGIKAEDLKRIFDSFYTTKTPDKNAGLGLSIVSNIVKSHQGYITVRSVPNKGTCFTVYFRTKRS